MLQEWEHDESRMPRKLLSAFDSYLSTSHMKCLDDPTNDLSIFFGGWSEYNIFHLNHERKTKCLPLWLGHKMEDWP